MTKIPDKVFDIIQTYDDTEDPKERLNIVTRCIMLTRHELNQMANEDIKKSTLIDMSVYDNETLTPDQMKLFNKYKNLNQQTNELNERVAKLRYENIEKCKVNLIGFEEMKKRLEKHIEKSG